MRNRPGLQIAVGLVVLIGLAFLGAKYGPTLLDNNQVTSPVENVDPSTEPNETEQPQEPWNRRIEPEPGNPNTPSQEREPECACRDPEQRQDELVLYPQQSSGAGDPEGGQIISTGHVCGDTHAGWFT